MSGTQPLNRLYGLARSSQCCLTTRELAAHGGVGARPVTLHYDDRDVNICNVVKKSGMRPAPNRGGDSMYDVHNSSESLNAFPSVLKIYTSAQLPQIWETS